MRYRNVELYYEQSLDNTGTKIIDLKTKDPVSAIRLKFAGTNGATNNQENRMDDVITKIEIVDGSDQIFSLNMKQAQVFQFYNTGKTPRIIIEERGSGSVTEDVLLLFGRYLYDPEYYLDLTKFTNPQLKITTDEDAVRALGATGFLTNTFKVTVNLHVIEEGAATAKGFFMYKELYAFTSGTSGDEHVDMTRDYPYASILLRAYVAGNDASENINNIKLSCDAGKFIPINKKTAHINDWNEEDYGPCQIRCQLERADGDTVLHIMNKEPVALLEMDETDGFTRAMYQWSGQFVLHMHDMAGSGISADRWIRALITGGGMHSTAYVPFGILKDPATYFDPKPWNDIDLVLTQAAAATVQIAAQQLRTYA